MEEIIEITDINIDDAIDRLSDIEQGFVEGKDNEHFELGLAIQAYLDSVVILNKKK